MKGSTACGSALVGSRCSRRTAGKLAVEHKDVWFVEPPAPGVAARVSSIPKSVSSQWPSPSSSACVVQRSPTCVDSTA